MNRKRGLGRGLETLLSPDAPASDGELRRLRVESIVRSPYQPRRHMDQGELEALADSIRAQGVVQPIVVRALGPDSYELVAGERRWRASQMAGLTEIPALVRELDNEAALAIALIENIQRQDLNALEEATALRRLTVEFGLTHEAVARAVGRSRSAVSNLLRLLDLEPGTTALLDAGKLEMGHARALLALSGTAQEAAARRIASEEMSVRQAERLITATNKDGVAPPAKPPADVNLKALEEELAQSLGAKVALQHGRRGGKMVIRYHSLDQLDGILARLR